jgi:hypothetical protein
MAAETATLKSSVEKLRALLEREPALRGDELASAVAEKERLILELGQGLRLGEEGEGERVALLENEMAPLSFANGLTLSLNRIRLQLSRLRQPQAPAAPAPRVDLIS